MADEINHKGFAQILRNPFMAHEIINVEEITGMLTIQCCDNLAGIEILERDNPVLGKTEGTLDSRTDLHDH